MENPTKICSICDKEKSHDSFTEHRRHCFECRQIKKRKTYMNKRAHYINKAKIYRNTHKKEIKNRNREYIREKRRTDENFRLRDNLRCRLYHVVTGNNKSASTMELLGCTIEELWIHLEKNFKDGMDRKNYGKWEIDHILPCASFDMTIREDQEKCFHYTNLAPIWPLENKKKGDRILPIP